MLVLELQLHSLLMQGTTTTILIGHDNCPWNSFGVWSASCRMGKGVWLGCLMFLFLTTAFNAAYTSSSTDRCYERQAKTSIRVNTPTCIPEGLLRVRLYRCIPSALLSLLVLLCCCRCAGVLPAVTAPHGCWHGCAAAAGAQHTSKLSIAQEGAFFDGM